MKPKTEQWEADSPVILEPGADADVIGNHLARVQSVSRQNMLKELDLPDDSVTTSFKVKKEHGKTVVHIVESKK